MKITYDEKSDTLTVILKDGPIVESDEEKPGVVLDFNASGELVSIEILDASARVPDARKIEFQALP